jgi:hypothetical protein
MVSSVTQFDRPKKTLSFAEKSIIELDGIVGDYFAKGPYLRSIVEEPTLLQKHVKYTQIISFPEYEVERKATHALIDLKHCFDQATWAACQSLNKNIRETDTCYFPWAKNQTDLDERLSHKSCNIPQSLWPVFHSLRPYGEADASRSSDQICRMLAKMANRKHSIGVAIACLPAGLSINGRLELKGPGPLSIFPDRRGPFLKDEFVAMTLSIDSIVHVREEVSFYVAFDKSTLLPGENVLTCLRFLSAKAHGAIHLLQGAVEEALGG